MISAAALAGALWLFQRCAPNAPVILLAGIAEQESGYDPDAIHDNTPSAGYPYGRSYYPASPNSAVDIAVSLVGAGHQIDVGILGIDYTSWQRHKVPLMAAFDQCANARISAEILMGDYDTALKIGYRGRSAWLSALSLYNTGSATSTIGATYANDVLANITRLTPLIERAEEMSVAAEGPDPSEQPRAAAPSPAAVAGNMQRTAQIRRAQAYAAVLAAARARQAEAERAYAKILASLHKARATKGRLTGLRVAQRSKRRT